MVTKNKQVCVWYVRAQVDYPLHYAALYTAFNAWYSQQVATTNDREAINRLCRRRCRVWDSYCEGTALHRLEKYMVQLVELTQREPLSHATPHWNGEVANKKDWTSLLEFWYRVRCLVVHGAELRLSYVQLAYDTLNIFMSEVVKSTDVDSS